MLTFALPSHQAWRKCGIFALSFSAFFSIWRDPKTRETLDFVFPPNPPAMLNFFGGRKQGFGALFSPSKKSFSLCQPFGSKSFLRNFLKMKAFLAHARALPLHPIGWLRPQTPNTNADQNLLMSILLVTNPSDFAVGGSSATFKRSAVAMSL